jgi:ABC-type cobalt transport system substrate-binding protein
MTSANLTMNYSISSGENDKNKRTQNKVKEMVVVTMTSLVQTILNDNRRSQFDGAEEGGEDKISEFFNSKLPWDMTLPIL